MKFAFAQILSKRLEHFIHLLKYEKDSEKEKSLILIEILLSNGITSNLISYLNENRDLEIENEIIEVILNVLNSKNLQYSVYHNNIIEFLDKSIDDEVDNKILHEVFENTDNQFETKNQLIKYFKEETDNDNYSIIQSIIRKNILLVEFGRYLHERIRTKLDIPQYKPVKPKREEKIEKGKIKILKWIHTIVYLVFPALYTVWHFETIAITPIWEQTLFYLIILVFPIVYSIQHIGLMKKIKYWEYMALAGIIFVFPILDFLQAHNWVKITTFKLQSDFFIMDFNFYLIYYASAISLIYIILLYFSYIGLHNQVRYAKVKKTSFLFKDKILPSISIVAPAYAEEENIIESVNSQLNLYYPNYELVVVSDGSPDNTLKVLIEYFALEKVDMVIDEKISTQPIRGIYRNEKNFPKLTVVDKANGGKADALNVGINVSKNEYFCGIDSDSLLEPDALIKLTSMMLNSEKESVAFGGNIFPINSCKVDRGKLEEIQIPKEPVAALQTIEYLRAFMAGRVGWAYINSLLIISGAFGLFKKDRVIEMGGYLTGKSRMKKDTVGEDMELVVRLNKFMLQNKLPYSIHYCYNANCWTEVPEMLKMQQVQTKHWKEKTIYYFTEVLYADGFLSEEKLILWQKRLHAAIHTNERLRILVNQRDRWHRGLIDILTYHKDMMLNPVYKQVGFVSLPYFFIFEMVGPLFEFQGYTMVIFAAFLGLLNTKVALLLFMSSIMMGAVISLSSLMIAEKESNLFTSKEIKKLITYAILENFGPRQIANFWRIKGFFSSMALPKGWGQMIRKTKPILVVAIENDEFRAKLTKALELHEYKVIGCNDGNTALLNIKKENLKLAILDENLSLLNAINICREIEKLPAKRGIPFGILSVNEEYMNESNQLLKDLYATPIIMNDHETTIFNILTFIKTIVK